MEWLDGAAGTLAGLCLREDGALREDEFIHAAARAAVLVDLAVAGRITHTPTDLSIDTTRTQYLSVNVLLEAIEAQPDRSVESWIGSGLPVLDALVGDLVRAGLWRWAERRRRWSTTRVRVPTDAGAWADRVARMTSIADGHQRPAGPVEACRVSVALTVHLIPGTAERPTAALLAACGPARWLTEITDAFIADARTRRADTTAYTTATGALG